MNMTEPQIVAVQPPVFRYFTKWLFALTLLWAVVFFTQFDNPVELVSHNWPLIFIGVIGAIIGNMTAIGGGLVFIPVLMFVYHLDPVSSLKLAFVSQAVGMTSGATGWLQRKVVPLELLKWTIPPLILGTLISTFLFHPTPLLVKGLFGPISVIVGALVLITFNRKGGNDALPARALIPLALMSVLGGVITGWVAIGEGEIIAAFCMLAYGLKADKAVGLGVVLLSVNSILLAAIHSLYFGGIPWDMAIFTILGVLWGGRAGPFISQHVSPSKLKKVFAWVALLDGLMIIFQVARASL